jgi:hypothetical protein
MTTMNASAEPPVLGMPPSEILTRDPYAGWTQASVGCHWTRSLSDGRAVHMSTWQRGGDSGYSLTINYERVEYGDLASALAAFERLDNVSAASGYVQ